MNRFKILNGNILKLIALITMTIDHIGLILFPDAIFLRIIGRIAFPIFAFFIAEGCRYTKNKTKYLLLMLGVGLFSQLFVGAFLHFYKLNILFTFSFSIILIYIYQGIQTAIQKHNKKLACILIGLFVIYLSVLVILFFPHIHLSNFTVDYGFFGIMLPFIVSLHSNKYIQLALFFIGLLLVSIFLGGIQYYGLISIIPIMLYNGERGRIKLKYLFYAYYPLHLMIILLLKTI